MAVAKAKEEAKAAAEAEMAAAQKKDEELKAMAAAKAKEEAKGAAEAEMAAAVKKDAELAAMATAMAKRADTTAAKAQMATGVDSGSADTVAAEAVAVTMVQSAIETGLQQSTTEVAEDARDSNGEYLLVTERLWKVHVARHETEQAARAHAKRLWSCCVVLRSTAPGAYEEVLKSGVSAPLAGGMAYPRIRKYIDENLGRLSTLARRPSIFM